VFSKPAIKALLQQYVLVQLYTDVIHRKFQDRSPTTAAENLELLDQRFGSRQLPLYVIVEPTESGEFREVARYDEGKINNVEAFADFLRRNAGNGAKATAQAADK
jgi:hypothetical protein